MKQNATTEEAKSKVDKRLSSNSIPLTQFQHWFIVSFILLLVGMLT
jgi:hypothetical protein